MGQVMSPRVGARFVLPVFILVGAVILGGAFLGSTGWWCGLNFPASYGEGPIVRDALLLAKGKLFYRYLSENPPFSLSNYTPLYYLLLSIPLSFTGASFIPGRIISLLAGCGVLFLVYRIVRARTGDREIALVAALVLFASPFSGNMVLNRVDATAALFSVGSLYLLLTSRSSIHQAVGAGALAGLAALTRQTSFLFPLIVALGVYGSKRSYREAAWFMGALGVVAGGVSGVLEYVSRGAYSFNVITANVNSAEWDRLLSGVYFVGLSFFAPLVVITLTILKRWDRPAVRSLLGWLFLGTIPTFLAVAKSGSNLNYLAEMFVALSLIFGLVVGEISRERARVGFGLIVVLVTAFPAMSRALPALNIVRDLERSHRRIESFLNVVRGSAGPLLTDDLMGVELLVGRAIIIQPYEVNQFLLRNNWSDKKFRRMLRTDRFGLAAISMPYARPFIRRERWTDAQWRLLRRSMKRSKRFAGSDIFLRRGGNGSSRGLTRGATRLG